MRFLVRVKPGASRARVGGSHGEPRALVVAVHAQPVDGQANLAVTQAIADAFGLRPRQVHVVSGHGARSKVIELDIASNDEPAAHQRLEQLLGG